MKVSDLFESPLPDTWDPQVFKHPTTQKEITAMLQYAKLRGDPIDGGSSRYAVKANRKVYKIAINKRGIDDNKLEVARLTDPSIQGNPHVVPLIDYAKGEMVTWIQFPLVKHITPKRFEYLSGFRVFDFPMAVDKFINPHKYDNIPLDAEEIEIRKHPIFQLLVKLVYLGCNVWEFDHLPNWGEYKGRLVVIDVGS